MKKQHLLLTLIVFSVASCFAQQNSKDNQNNKPYLKKYLTNGITVELWGFNKDGIFIPEGKVTTYYSNKQKALEGNYKNGKAEGNWKLYYENGQLKTSADYSMGSLNGELKTYYDNGSIASLLPYSKGFIDGTSIYYNTNNAKRYEITFYKNRLSAIKTYKFGRPYENILLASYADIMANKIKRTGEYPFDEICSYTSGVLKCKTTEDFIKDLLAMGIAVDIIADIMANLQKMWEEYGLKGNVLVKCGAGFMGMSDLGSQGKPGRNDHSSLPSINGTGNSSFKGKVDDACSKAMLDGKVRSANANFTGNGISLAGPGGKSPKQDLIDKAKARMDVIVKNCKEGDNSMIAFWPALAAFLATPQGQLALVGLGVVLDKGYDYLTADPISTNPIDVYRDDNGVFKVEELDDDYEVVRNNDGSSDVAVTYRGEYDVTTPSGDLVTTTRLTRQTCHVESENTSCNFEVENFGSWTSSTQTPKNAKSNTQINQAAKGADCAVNPNGVGCEEYRSKHPANAQAKGNQNPETTGSKCDQIKGAWARMKTDCEKSNWQTQACIELVYFMNGCPIDLTVTDPTPDGGLYSYCHNGDAEVLEKACDRKKLIQNHLPDGPVSQSECLDPSSISKIHIGFDPCGPDVQPTNEGGCNPPTNVPSETGPAPSPVNNPIFSPLFKNNQFKTFGEYVQHNQYMRNSAISNSRNFSLLTSNKVNDISISQKPGIKSGNTIVVFYSNSCQPSLNYLSQVQKNLREIETNATVYIADVGQNPELRR